MTLFALKVRLHFAWNVLIGKYEPASITPLDDGRKAKDAALDCAMRVLESLGKRQHGGSVAARAAHAFITTQLQSVGVVL